MPRLLLLLAVICLRVNADDIGLVRVGEMWRYFKGVNEPSSIAGEWKEGAFVDTTWTQAPGPFSSLGVNGIETTALGDFGTTYTTVYFRKKFQVTNPEAIAWLILRVDYDDGFVAYLNGVEVVRRGVMDSLPGELVPFNGTAAKHFRNAVEEIDLNEFKELLKQGENLLAIQTLNSGVGDFTMCMSVELLGNFIRGPFLQNATTNSVQVIWKTHAATDGAVEFGTDSNNVQTISSLGTGTNHVMTVTNLAPNTEYYYRVRSSNETATAYSPFEKFRTLKTEGPVSFSVIGDTGSGSY